MTSLKDRIGLLTKLGAYLKADGEAWQEVKQRAVQLNSWFTKEAVDLAVQSIVDEFLIAEKLEAWVAAYDLPVKPVKLGIVMAGNIPLVGFHDFLCGFICGHDLYLKLSSKDEVMLKHIIRMLGEWEPAVMENIHVTEMLKGCEAYIATGSNNSSRYFEQYFAKYPHLIRRNRTSVAVLDGSETAEELELLADDVFTYYGLGCRNVTQVCVPEGYDFKPMMDAFSKYDELVNHHKYKNNYDYHLALYLLNRVPYLTNETVLLVENTLPFSAVSVLHYRYYNDKSALQEELHASQDIQAIIGHDELPFGSSQKPTLTTYADKADTMQFLTNLGKD